MSLDAELDALRAAVVSVLPNRATVQRRETVSDGGLGTTETWVTRASNVPCRVDENREGRMAVVGSSVESTGDLVVRLRYGTPVDEGDQVVVFINHRVRTFDVTRVSETSFATTVNLQVTEVR